LNYFGYTILKQSKIKLNMLTIYQATTILESLQIPHDIQNKILIFFLSYGTFNSCLIKIKIKEMIYFYTKHPKFMTPTLWRFYCKGINPRPFKNKQNIQDRAEYLYELDIANLCYCKQVHLIYTMMERTNLTIQQLTKTRLNKMIASDPIIEVI